MLIAINGPNPPAVGILTCDHVRIMNFFHNSNLPGVTLLFNKL